MAAEHLAPLLAVTLAGLELQTRFSEPVCLKYNGWRRVSFDLREERPFPYFAALLQVLPSS